jgi:hypothetical protein
MHAAIPIASPNIFRRLYVLFLFRFRKADFR